jgi:hypothetical protein
MSVETRQQQFEDAIKARSETRPDASTVASGAVTVSVKGGWKLCFQKQYREFWIEQSGRGSFSREMTPDVAVMHETGVHGAERLIILDAKYRIEENLNAALNSIHTYRDALVREAEVVPFPALCPRLTSSRLMCRSCMMVIGIHRCRDGSSIRSTGALSVSARSPCSLA